MDGQATIDAAPAREGQPVVDAVQNLSVRQRASMRARRRQSGDRSSSPANNPDAGAAAASTTQAQSPGAAPATSDDPAAAAGAIATEPNSPDARTARPADSEAGNDAPGAEDFTTQPNADSPTDDPGAELAADGAVPEGALGVGDQAAAEDSGDEPEGTSQQPEWLAEILRDLPESDRGKINAKLVKRVHQVVEQRDAERNRRLELERRMAEGNLRPDADSNRDLAGGQPGDQAGQSDQAGIPDRTAFDTQPQVRQVDQQIQQVLGFLDWAERNPDGAPVSDGSGNEIDISADQVRAKRIEWSNQLSRLNARREAMVVQLEQADTQKRQASIAQARKAYPWMNNPQSPEYQEALALVRTKPGITNDPEWPMLVGDYVNGRMARTTKPAAAKPAAKAKLGAPMQRPSTGATPPPVVTATGQAPPKEDALTRDLREAQAEFRKTGSVKARTRVASLQRKVRQRTAA